MYCPKCQNTLSITNEKQQQQIVEESSKKIKREKIKKTASLVCSNCGFNRRMNEGTVLYSKSVIKKTPVYSYHDMIYSDIVPHTRNYNCPNDKCDTHAKPEKLDAIFFREGDTFNMIYICTVCKTQF